MQTDNHLNPSDISHEINAGPRHDSLGNSDVGNGHKTPSIGQGDNDSSFSQRIVIVGSGIAGLSAAKAARKQDAKAQIVMLSEESHPTYYRLRLCELIGKNTSLESYYIHPLSWYSSNGFSLFLDCNVISIHIPKTPSKLQEVPIKGNLGNVEVGNTTDENSFQIRSNTPSFQADMFSNSDCNMKYVLTSKGNFYFDKLVIASGSTPAMPPFPGKELSGIFTLWNLDNITAINKALTNSQTAVVVGGGLLGLETAYNISKMGISTTLIEGLPRILPKQIDEGGSEIFAQKIESLGIQVITGQSVKEFKGEGHIETIILSDGQILNADIVVVSVGVRPNTSICSNSGILLDRYIPVNDRMQVIVSNENNQLNVSSEAKQVTLESSENIAASESIEFSDCIYAAGDVSSYNKTWFGQWTVATLQGQIAGTNAAGGDAVYKMDNSPYILNTMETKIIVSGDVITEGEEHIDVLQDANINAFSYIKLVFKKGILTGGILIGEPSSKFVKLQTLIKDKVTRDSVTLIDFL